MAQLPVLIAGGGIAGLAASLGLARKGLAAQVFEQSKEFSEVGAGLQMSPNAVRALQWLGAWEAIEPNCVTPSEIHVRDGRTAALLQRLRLGKPFEQSFGAPYRVAHRADLLAGLVAAARSSPLPQLNTGASVVATHGAAIELSDGRRELGMAVIAADGIGSTLRQQAWPSTAPEFRGHAIYRALIPLAAVPPAIANDCVTLWLYPGGHVVHYAVSAWRQFNIVAAIDSPWTADAWSEPGDPAELKAAFADAALSLAELIAAPPNWLRWAGADLAPRANWTRGPLALAGDAAHATLPYLAQGAAMALEDACILAASLGRDTDVAGALAHYEHERRPRTARIQLASRRLAGLYHARGVTALARNAALKLAPADHLLRRYGWIYDWRPPE
ncbi:MAG: FAD-dependent monooxygenase [Rhizobiales bacterium]|nr:FAD-dependent monooxygenase [Hyphomicrobiales bacterium]